MKKRPFLLGLLWLFCRPASALAVQVHGDPEGYLVHQMGHFFFVAALFFLLYVLSKRPPGLGKPWKHLKISLVLFLLWNLDTVLVHWLAYRLPEEAFLAKGGSLLDDRLALTALWPWGFYYLGSFDHLLCVPASWFLILSLKGFCAEVACRQKREEVELP